MNKKNVTIETPLAKSEIHSKLSNIIINKANLLSALTKKKYQGELNENQFNLLTYDSPPVEVFGEINNQVIKLQLKWDTMSSAIKAFILVIGYCIIAMVMGIQIKKDPSNIWTYIIGGLSLLIPYAIAKLYVLLYYSEPDPDKIVKKINKLVRGTITESV